MQTNGIGIFFGGARSSERKISYSTNLLYLINGKVSVEADGREYTLGEEDFMVISPGTAFALTVNEPGGICRISFDSSVTNMLFPSGKPAFYCISSEPKSALPEERTKYRKLLESLRTLLYTYLKSGNRATAEIMGQSYEILNLLGESFSCDSEGDEGDRDTRISEIITYIQENYVNQITLSDLAKKFYLSVSHLSRLFKSTLGQGFREYLNELRLEAAERELRDTEKSIIRIANDNGFSGLAAFNRSFKEKYGETPSVYRRLAEKERAAEQAAEAAEAEKTEAGDFIEKYEASLPGKAAVKTYTCDANDAHPYIKPWKSALNFGAASDILNPQVQAHIVELQKHIEFSYVRFWNLFLENFIYFPNALGNKLFFSKFDGVINFLLSHNLKPYIQLGPKPRTIISSFGAGSADSIQRSDSDYVAKFSDEEWEDVIEKIIVHAVTRFGEEEVETWIFEMWQPNAWDGFWYDWFSYEKFAAVFRCVKKYVPNALVGGCEFKPRAQLSLLPEITKEWKRHGIDPDFISFDMLPYDVVASTVGRPAVTVWHPETQHWENSVQEIIKSVDENGLGDKKIFFSIWNITASNRNLVNDSVIKGAVLIETALKAIGSRIGLMAYWVGTDAYGEGADTTRMLFGGTGLINRDQIMKPSLHAFAFLKKMRSRIIDVGPNYAVTANNFGVYSIIYHNAQGVPLPAMLKDETSITYADLTPVDGDEKTLSMKILVKNVQNGIYNVRRQYVNRESGSSFDEWNRIGAFEILAKEDLDYISTRATPDRVFERQRVTNETIEIDISAQNDEFGIIELEYQHGVGGGQMPPPGHRAFSRD